MFQTSLGSLCIEFCYTVGMEKVKIEHSTAGGFWIAGWLFTIGFLHLGFWKGVLAIVLWPYYLGLVLAM